LDIVIKIYPLNARKTKGKQRIIVDIIKIIKKSIEIYVNLIDALHLE